MKKSELAIVCLALCIPLVHGCVASVMAGDRRSTGTVIDDSTIESKVRDRINEKYDDQVHVDLASFNRFVLLVGDVPNQQFKDEIGAIALGVENVRNVQNELIIGPNPPGSTHANDAYLTSKVKARFVSENKFQANHVRVITESGVVYLMGLVTRQEGDAAADIAATTGGVLKVVKVFEYL